MRHGRDGHADRYRCTATHATPTSAVTRVWTYDGGERRQRAFCADHATAARALNAAQRALLGKQAWDTRKTA